jgi:Niemann-Pick C1 protein
MEAFLSNQFRVQGEWIAQNALAVLAVALIIAVVLCLGLLWLTVETRPEKLWVAPGSQAAGEKEFFDTHLAPFYRIEQVFFFALYIRSSYQPLQTFGCLYYTCIHFVF